MFSWEPWEDGAGAPLLFPRHLKLDLLAEVRGRYDGRGAQVYPNSLNDSRQI